MCASHRTVQSDMEDSLKKIVERINPQDMLILMMGGYVGYRGANILEFLGDLSVKGFSNVASLVSESEKSLPGSSLIYTTPGGAGIAVGTFLAGLFGISAPEPDASDTTKEDFRLSMEAKLTMACMGAIFAYMLTRPGFISGVGSILQGVGEIIPF